MDMFTTELLGKYPPMDAADVPDEWIELAKCGYSMHGRGLVANLLAAAATMIQAQAPGADELVTNLRAITADLNGHLGRRAAELAEPAIKAAQHHADETVAEAQHDAQRQADLVTELRRRLAPLERTRDKHTRLRETAHRVLRTYQTFLDSDDLDALRDALTDLQEAANA